MPVIFLLRFLLPGRSCFRLQLLPALARHVAAKVDENPDDLRALQYLRLAADCANLERDVDLLTQLLLKLEKPDRTG